MANRVPSDSEKLEVAHLETAQENFEDLPTVDGKYPDGLLKSKFDELSIPRTLWVFGRVVLVSLAVYTGYVCEGFEVSNFLYSGQQESDIVAATILNSHDIVDFERHRHCERWFH